MPSSKRKLIFVTRDWSGLGLAVLARSQGSQVICAYEYDEKKQDEEDIEHMECLGEGLVDKVPLELALRKYLKADNLWVFDTNEIPKAADRLRKAGELVIGTSSLSARMESDRDYAAEVAESVGLGMPETQKFTDYNAALKFLEANKDKSYVYKPFGGDATSTYVPQEREDLAKANEELREYIISLEAEGKPQFILQEVVEGIEAAFDLWVRNGEPVAAFCDLEAKRKLTGDLGENIGCAGGYVFKVPLNTKGVQETVARYLKWKELKSYTGSVDVNVIIVKGKPLFLENCFRFGYAAYPAMFHGSAKASVEEILVEWVSGRRADISDLFSSDFAGSLTLTSDNAKEGSPILIPEKVSAQVDLYRAYSDDGHLRMAQGWMEICCVIATGRTIESAGQSCLDLAQEVTFPDKGYRLDLASDSLPNLPLSRFRALQVSGYLKPQ